MALPARTTIKRIIDRTLDYFRDKDEDFLGRSEILGYINDCKDDLVNKVNEIDEKYFYKKEEITMANGTAEYDLADDHSSVQNVGIQYGGQTKPRPSTYRRKELIAEEDEPLFSKNDPYHTLYNKKIKILPEGNSDTGIINVHHDYHPADFGLESELPYPLNKYPQVFLNYCLSMGYYKDENKGMGDKFDTKYQNGAEELIGQITQPQHGEGGTIEDNDLDIMSRRWLH